MNKKIFFMLCLVFSMASLSFAGEQIGVFANSNTNSIQFIDPVTQTISGSLLKGSLGSYGGGLFDVVITSDGKTAIVSNFGDSRIFFIDISGGFDAPPTIVGKTHIPFFAEDMALTPDDKYVLITDGGFAPSIAIVDVATHKLANIQSFGTAYSNAIAVSPCKSVEFGAYMVLSADYFQGRINVFRLYDATLDYVKSIDVLPARPVNVEFSPDGHTAIAATANGYRVPVFEVSCCSYVNFKGFVIVPHKSGQSCVFSLDGTKAYYLSNSVYYRAMIEVLDVIAPGQVTSTGISIPARPKKGTSQLFGVDTIAIEPSGNYLYVANPTLSGGSERISIIDLTINQQVNYVQANGIPTGIAFATIDD
jgi:DNA-binding beta-propeller fold protein YncE